MVRRITTKARNTLKEYARVLKVTKKPTSDEFKTIFKVAGLGLILIGLIGFIIQMLHYYLF